MPGIITRLLLAVLGACVLVVGAMASSFAVEDAGATNTVSAVPADPMDVGAVGPDHTSFLTDRLGGVACVAANGVAWVPSTCDSGALIVAVAGADDVCYRPAPAPDLAADAIVVAHVGGLVLDLCIRTGDDASIDTVGLPIPPPRRDGVEADANCIDATGPVFVGIDDLHRLDHDDNGVGCDEPGHRK